jgi:5-methylcytosine-specific restriction endonuclease McrA
LTPEPTAEEQLAFLAKIQRLFAEGEFAATYKFALLISLAELAVEVPPLGGETELELSIRSIATKFIELYWRQSFEYIAGRPGTGAGVLVQNHGKQAAVISAIRSFRKKAGTASASLAVSRHLPGFPTLVTEVSKAVSAQPLKFLQNFGGKTDQFLYARARSGFILLRPGVVHCLQRFQPLIQQLARSHWIDHVKANRRNAGMVGEPSDLESFLFSSSRAALVAFGQQLRKLVGADCFYCGGSLNREADVDHFLPFAMYPRDLGHNFVLAHASCNRSKSDTLAAYEHLARWLERNDRVSAEIAEISEECGLVHDVASTRAIGRWGYHTGHEAHGVAWLSKGSYEPIGVRHLALFEA